MRPPERTTPPAHALCQKDGCSAEEEGHTPDVANGRRARGGEEVGTTEYAPEMDVM